MGLLSYFFPNRQKGQAKPSKTDAPASERRVPTPSVRRVTPPLPTIAPNIGKQVARQFFEEFNRSRRPAVRLADDRPWPVFRVEEYFQAFANPQVVIIGGKEGHSNATVVDNGFSDFQWD